MITYKQLTLVEIFEDFKNKFDNAKYQFLSLLAKPLTLMRHRQWSPQFCNHLQHSDSRNSEGKPAETISILNFC